MSNDHNIQPIDNQLLACRHITNVCEPYVWRLKMSADEYKTLGSRIKESIQQHGGSNTHLYTAKYALIILTYLAEWYKREYTGTPQVDSQRAIDIDSNGLKAIWEVSGINIDKYVYQTENGNRLWQYSTFVLGGLAIKHELNRPAADRDKFLKALCRIYHGEEYTLENLDEVGRAIAFRQSILQKHSLYEYFREILNGDYSDQDEFVQSLLIHIKSANDEVLKSKFRFEWIITVAPWTLIMNRRLRVWLKPEEIGGGLHQYLRFDRLHLLGIAEPEKIKMLHFSIRWMNGVKIVTDINKQRPLISYANTGDENGFVSWGIDRYAVVNEIPTQRFTHIQIIAFDDYDKEYLTQDESASEWMQLWRIDPWKDEWSSRQSAQHQTAVIFNDAWHTDHEPDWRRPFVDQHACKSSAWNFCYISSSITLYHSSGREMTLYNRVGYDQIYTRLYQDTILYSEGGLVSNVISDEEEGDIEELLPLIFSKQDIWVRYFVTKDAISHAEVEKDNMVENVEFKQSNGYYLPWNDENIPSYGVNMLRTTLKGVEHHLKVIFLPGPIVRNIEQCTIEYQSINGDQQIYQDTIPMDKKPLSPFVPIRIGDAIVNVIRPTFIKEIYLDDEVHLYHDGSKKQSIPYLLKNRIRVADFNQHGYQVYDCKKLHHFYPFISENDDAGLGAWKNGIVIQASQLDAKAPSWLRISVGDVPNGNYQGLKFYVWNPYGEDTPKEVDYDTSLVQKNQVLFQDFTHPNDTLTNIEPVLKYSPFGVKATPRMEWRCYQVACRYNLYFFIFKPLKMMVKNGKIKELLVQPLLNQRGGTLSDEDVQHLLRFAEEFNIPRSDLNLDMDDEF